MIIGIEGFDWDKGNIVKCQKHGLSQEEIESFFHGEIFVAPDIKHSQAEERFIAVGYAFSGKPMIVVFAIRNNLIRPISASFMHSKEAKAYEKNFTQDKK